MGILKIQNLTKKYGKHKVLNNINITIDNPGIYAVIGPNGSGKTTLFNTISNLLKPTSGEIEVLGKNNRDTNMFFEVAFLKDNRVLYDYLSGYDHLEFIRSAQKLPKERIDEVIDKLEIRDYVNKRVGEYSLGMKQHLLIAMSLMNKPKLLILDEPLNGLDPTSVIKVRKIFKELAQNGSAILISSHTLSEIDKLTNNILFLKDGKIFEEILDYNYLNIYRLYISNENKVKVITSKIFDNKIVEVNYNNLLINLGKNKLPYLINQLEEHNIQYIDITKEEVGSEQRYIEIFCDRI